MKLHHRFILLMTALLGLGCIATWAAPPANMGTPTRVVATVAVTSTEISINLPQSVTAGPHATATFIPPSVTASVTSGSNALPSTLPVTVGLSPVPISSTPSTLQLSAGDRLIWPELTELQPVDAFPGETIHVTGEGGYIVTADGGYNESARSFVLTFDNNHIGTLECYIHRCEGEFIIPTDTAPAYTLSL